MLGAVTGLIVIDSEPVLLCRKSQRIHSYINRLPLFCSLQSFPFIELSDQLGRHAPLDPFVLLHAYPAKPASAALCKLRA